MQAPPTIDTRALRRALGCFPTGVTIVTTLGADGAFVGLTVNSFNSLSLDPPLILWSLSTHSTSLRAFESAEHFAVNILADDQAAISRRFALRGPNKFHEVAVHAGLGGVPLIEGCAAYIECRAHSSMPAGDHVLFVGRVERVRTSGRAPLVYIGGRYHGAGIELA
ncbi:MAG: flavin reductase family protein [Burkholderiales bacterium]|nr:flavin reductase family protein [Burkholderiales bacterium]OJX03875.1 MAG: nitrilotriacetate monooxygenase [Burkholderiales bacterium 70-64]